MPHTSSARKCVRQNATHRALNHWRKRQVKDQVKSFLKALQDKDVKEAENAFRNTCGILDKVACTSTLHRNTVARRKSRMAGRLNALKAAKT